jgi:hypothetical protein
VSQGVRRSREGRYIATHCRLLRYANAPVWRNLDGLAWAGWAARAARAACTGSAIGVLQTGQPSFRCSSIHVIEQEAQQMWGQLRYCTGRMSSFHSCLHTRHSPSSCLKVSGSTNEKYSLCRLFELAVFTVSFDRLPTVDVRILIYVLRGISSLC